MRYRETFIIKHGERLILKGVDPAGKEHHESEPGAKDEIEHYRSQLAKLQLLLYAEKKRSILVVLQAMDAGAKTEWSITCYPSSIRKVRELMASSGQR